MDRTSNSPAEAGAGRLRAAAAETVAAVMAGESLDAALPRAQARFAAAANRALLQRLCYGVLRDWRLLEQLRRPLMQRPLDGSGALQALLAVGLYQLRSTRTPPHAAVSETVAAASLLGEGRRRGLVNAVLRRWLREREQLEAALPDDPATRHSHPDWLVQQLRTDWPQSWRRVLEANQAQGPMTLRVNRRRIRRDRYLQQLNAAGIPAAVTRHSTDAIRLEQPLAIEALPGFGEGLVSVQDEAAQLAVNLLALDGGTGRRVLDACAAPGGKAAHMLECHDVEVLALDRDPARLRKVEETLQRLGLYGRCAVADALVPRAWWDGQSFDRILLDAPCSGTGVIRRHPDIKWLRRASDIPRLAAMQSRLLDALWPLLAPGGMLVYAVCSVLRAEGESVIADFLRRQTDAREYPIESDWGEPCTTGRRIAPGHDDMDGFYYARLRKLQVPTPGRKVRAL